MADNKRVILITGDKSKWYEQAIFIVRRDCLQKEMPKDFVSEAERIVDRYISGNENQYYIPILDAKTSRNTVKTSVSSQTKNNKQFDRVLNITMIICIIILAALVSYAYFA